MDDVSYKVRDDGARLVVRLDVGGSEDQRRRVLALLDAAVEAARRSNRSKRAIVPTV